MINKFPLYGLNTIAVRYFTKSAILYNIFRGTVNSPESGAIVRINPVETVNHLIINKILLTQNLSITKSKLEELLKVKGVIINLPAVTPEGKKLLSELTGKSKYKGFFGVYIFIHKITGKKYVGSSNLLRRRMDYYFKGDFPLQGKFLPLLRKEGLRAFNLVLFKLDSLKFRFQDALILEQYFLLTKEFDLNTLKVVNAGSSKGDSVYVYNLNCSILFYHAKSKIELKRVLKIHPETSTKFVDSKIPYLNKFLLLSFYIPTALISDISVQDLVDIMQKERKATYELGSRRSIPVILEIKEGNTFVRRGGASQNIKEHTLKFDSLTACIEYLKKLGLTIKRDTLTKYIKNEKVFHNFLCKYLDLTLPNDFREIGLIIDEYKKLKVKSNLDSFKVNKKNKSVFVKGEKFEKKFESIMDLIRYFETLGLKLDRKTLNIRLKDGNKYKGYHFSYE